MTELHREEHHDLYSSTDKLRWPNQKNMTWKTQVDTYEREYPCFKQLISCKVKQQLYETVISDLKNAKFVS